MDIVVLRRPRRWRTTVYERSLSLALISAKQRVAVAASTVGGRNGGGRKMAWRRRGGGSRQPRRGATAIIWQKTRRGVATWYSTPRHRNRRNRRAAIGRRNAKQLIKICIAERRDQAAYYLGMAGEKAALGVSADISLISLLALNLARFQ